MIYEIKDDVIDGNNRKIRHLVLRNGDIFSEFKGWTISDYKLGQCISSKAGMLVSYNNVKMIKNEYTSTREDK